MEFNNVDYAGSFSFVDDCPDLSLPEVALIGRSNVGKSSLINALCERRSLAFISSHPGKTQSINLYVVNEKVVLTDLPGYGYAKVSKAMRGKWEKMVRNYLLNRKGLYCVLQLVDASIPPQSSDIEFSNQLGEQTIPFVIVFTKTDKRSKTGSGRKAYLAKLQETWETLPPSYAVSAVKRTGLDPLREFILGAG